MSLQIPSPDSAAGPSRHHTSLNTAAAATARPVSVSVHQSLPPPASATSRRQQRASHTVVSGSAQQQTHHQGSPARDEGPVYTDVYSHPAAQAYAAAHPRRTIPKFGPYLLLQTLGEGEFGKVKLGLHSQWGEEVAVKLIRRGNVDSAVRMSKVEREIEVLRTLKHPNIVRLYDVIETDKYIGIILEYASGGELFDHILAHRYLRERDAAKLFSQLISGVWYIHQKKIVHRDLKLENLLLDKHRNVIITDFGFANRFEHRADDLMQTSCGSPCYAAPELVISEGLYVGSAVDIWSCGVILYAMLAGYLPFDDDPANPDGDNINLLYKYIVNTPLSFPDYISAEARDLLGMMLVPDPTRRSSLEGVMKHPWLAAYAVPKDGNPASIGMPTAFGRSVDQLERAAMEQHQQKRLAYQKQMKAAALAVAPATTRTQSHNLHSNGAGAVVPNHSTRSRSTQPEYLYDSSIDQSFASTAQTPPSSAKKPTYGSPSVLPGDDDPFAPPPGSAPAAVASPPTLSPEPAQTPKSHKTTGSGGGNSGDKFRHTIQVEYGEPTQKNSRRSEDKEREKRARERSGSQGQNSPPAAPNVQTNGTPGTKERRPSQGSVNMKPLPPSPSPPSAPAASTTPSSYRSPTQNTTPPPNNVDVYTTPTKSKNSTPKSTNSARPGPIVPLDPQTPTVNINPASPPDTPITFMSPNPDERDNGSQGSSKKGHKKGRSSIDKLGFAKIFGGAAPTPGEVSPALNGRVPSDGGGSAASAQSSNNASSVLLSPVMSEKEKDGKKSRRNTLTVMVEPITRSVRNRTGKGRMASTPGGNVGPVPVSAVEMEKGTPSVGSATIGAKSAVGPVPSFAGAAGEMGEAGGAGMQASTSKARKVMAWFRTKSKVSEEEKDVDHSGTLTDAEYKKGNAASSSAVNTPTFLVTPTVKVMVTTPTPTGHPRQPSVTPTESRRVPSTGTESSFMSPRLVMRFRNSVNVGGSGNQSAKDGAHRAGSGSVTQHPWGALRIHHGAVDQTTITTKAPPEVIKHVLEVLEGMGVEIQMESEYKYRCVRAKKRKGSMIVGGGTGVGLGSVGPGGGASSGGTGLAAFTMVGSAASNGQVDKRGLPVPSPSSFSGTGGMLRGLLMRRQTSQVSANGMGAPSPLGFDDDAPVIEPSTNHDTTYGDPSQDAGDEVRFSVELTRLDRLNDTFSLDIRRLKGNLRSYKFLYDTIRQRADLQR
ncbi:hypothetical protein BDZ94DRAFT_1192949 [Collybia nuda]|uniref:non-specific serine/threonine protein kinase n=1 Tax=Collybia nuda TaxID=64659 RepID=A0A9P6CET7_9AGAR|nr:hypothetical protein BDZ94DRAFT_1192949 [Collybia nuda]